MTWTQLPLGELQTNCYLVENEAKDCIIIDPGANFKTLEKKVADLKIHPKAVLLTHAHFDHIGALDEVVTAWQIPVYIHKEEADWLGDPEKNGSALFPGFAAVKSDIEPMTFNGEKRIDAAGFQFELFETPGHSPGSVSFYNQESGVVFAGDTLFFGSIGRTDLYRADHEELISSIKKKLLTLPEETKVAPGHGFETVIGQEKLTNPFLLY